MIPKNNRFARAGPKRASCPADPLYEDPMAKCEVCGNDYDKSFTVTQGGSKRRVDLFWADPLGQAANDYDFYILDSTGANVVAAGNTTQSGFSDPYESVNKIDPGERLVIVRYSGAARFLHLSTGRGRLDLSTSGQTLGHNSAVNAFCVAAVPAANASGSVRSGRFNSPATYVAAFHPLYPTMTHSRLITNWVGSVVVAVRTAGSEKCCQLPEPVRNPSPMKPMITASFVAALASSATMSQSFVGSRVLMCSGER